MARSASRSPRPALTRIEHADVIFLGELIATSDNRSPHSPFWASLSLFHVALRTPHYLLVEEWYVIDDPIHAYPNPDPPPKRTTLHADLDSVFATLSNHDIVTRLRDQANQANQTQEKSK